ncbi:ATP-grasp domain-containing protein [Thermodesulfatator atlanticus]|uniref:ATP-grasp domain-containing protein n=1 Tax=Thermodesulfatator atlanticus TaxID=501497 RepID=UPI0003B65845|nr:30S ribosomal protein S6 modification enzyme RimK [Thermodesulfatator atlanticus]
MRPPWVILSNRTFRKLYHELKAGDFILGRLSVKFGEEFLFTDLQARGIKAYPSFLSQYLARSKCFQTLVYSNEMLPGTRLIRDRHDLIRAVNEYGASGVKKVVLKQDRYNCGLGVHIFENIENVFNFATFGNLSFPFVLQPFMPNIADVRVIILGDYLEAYMRKNPYNFRNNLFFGGEARPYQLSEEEYSFCQRVMERGKFPFAHIDLMITQEGRFYLSEINLRGGLKGACIKGKTYEQKVNALHEKALKAFLEENPGAKIFD